MALPAAASVRALAQQRPATLGAGCRRRLSLSVRSCGCSSQAKPKSRCLSCVEDTSKDLFPGSEGRTAARLLGMAALAAVPSALLAQGAAAASQAARAADTLAEAMAAEGIVPVDPANYVPTPIEVGWEIYFGAFAGAFPFAIGLYEFTKRIMIQRRCETCKGTGLVTIGKKQIYETKCPQCGGFFPWRSWSEFLSANARPGNGGVLRFPKGQTSVFYTVPDKPPAAPQAGQVPPTPAAQEAGLAGTGAPVAECASDAEKGSSTGV